MAVTIGHRQVANSTWAAMTPAEREAFRVEVRLEREAQELERQGFETGVPEAERYWVRDELDGGWGAFATLADANAVCRIYQRENPTYTFRVDDMRSE